MKWLRLIAIANLVGLVLLVFSVVGVAYYVAEEASHRAGRERADAVQQVAECVDARTRAPATLRFLEVVQVILDNQVAGTVAQIEAEPGSLANAGRRQRLRDARRALADVISFRARVNATTPSQEECRQLAERLNVEPQEPSA